MTRDCRRDWTDRWDEDGRWRQAWADAAAEVWRFNAEEEPGILSEEVEEESTTHEPWPEIDYEALGLRSDWGLIKDTRIDGQKKYARIFIRRRSSA